MGEEIKSFKITTNRRYWEDEDFGILVKRGAQFSIYPKHLRSYMLKFSIMRGDVLLVEGEKCTFGFKGRILDVVGGKDKNLITIISENGKKVNKKIKPKSTNAAVGKYLKPKRKDTIVIPEPDPKKKPKKAVFDDVNTDQLPEKL